MESYIGHRKRMRQKLLKSSDNLLDYELLELLLFNIFPRRDVKIIAKEMIRSCGGLSKVFFTDYFKLKNIPDIGDSTIAMIFTIRQIMKTILEEKLLDDEQIILDDQQKIISYLRMTIGNNPKESICVLYLNSQMNLIHSEVNDYGTIDQVSIYNREIIKKALDVGAMNLILSHNHPSDNPKPSEADIKQTTSLNDICKKINIRLVDHIIITANKSYSFYKNGII